MINAELSTVFRRIADLMEIRGEDRFRINSYRRVSRVIKDTITDIAELAADGRLTELPGVGKGTAAKIEEYVERGSIGLLDELSSKLPAGLPDLLEVPGLGPKKVALAYHELKVGGMQDLKRAIADGSLAGLAGMGEISVKRIAEGIAFLESSGGRIALGQAVILAEPLAETVRAMPGVERVEIAGSLRRGCETIGDIDLLCIAPDGADIVGRFVKLDGVKRVLASGATKGSITIDLDSKREVQIDLRVVEAAAFGAAWQYFTGSKQHNVRLREIAVKRGWRLNEYGVFDGEKRLAGSTEKAVYRKLGLPWIPPELREDRGEFENPAAGEKLVTIDDIRGDLHMHTVASDGKSTLDEMAAAAKALGYAYIAIADHSKSSAVAGGLSIDRMWQQIEDVRAADGRIKGIKILVACECDILADGRMDYPDDLLAECDLVVASIHSAIAAGRVSVTKRTLAAIDNPYVSIIGHPTSRLINKRASSDLDIAAVAKAAADSHTALEVSAAWKRLDLKDLHARQAIDAGVMLCINTDSHHTDQLKQMPLGVTTARRAGAEPDHILNTRTIAGLQKWLGRKRSH
ncbi:MAG: DNA polymerase/3'-5' exonuclease PolX [Planctomycetes bacterium]|nr:DNA polymerase/3'-5' exonuclease PolX [Planctomycetota bacterium]